MVFLFTSSIIPLVIREMSLKFKDKNKNEAYKNIPKIGDFALLRVFSKVKGTSYAAKARRSAS